MDVALTGISFDHSQDSILVHTVVDERPHLIYVPVLALASRMAMYGLETESDAFEAIMREHHHRLNETYPESGTHVERAAGLQEVTDGSLSIPAEAHDALAQIVTEHQPRLVQAHAAKLKYEASRRSSAPPPQAVTNLWLAEEQHPVISKAYDKGDVRYQPGVLAGQLDVKAIWKSLGGHVLSGQDVTADGLDGPLGLLAAYVPGTPVHAIVRPKPEPTPPHVDESLVQQGCDTVTLFVERKGKMEGFLTVFPDLELAFDLQDGDALSYGTRMLHGNTLVTDRGEGAYRRLIIVGSTTSEGDKNG